MLHTWIQPQRAITPSCKSHISLNTSIVTTEKLHTSLTLTINQLQPQHQVTNCDMREIINQNETMAYKYGLPIMVASTRKIPSTTPTGQQESTMQVYAARHTPRREGRK
jgi:hypothetical protein